MFIQLWSRQFCLEIQLMLLFRSCLWNCFKNSSICSPHYHQRMMHNQSKSFLDESGEQLVSQLLIFNALKSIVSSILGHQEGMISRSSLALKTCFYTFTSSFQMRNWLKNVRWLLWMQRSIMFFPSERLQCTRFTPRGLRSFLPVHTTYYIITAY